MGLWISLGIFAGGVVLLLLGGDLLVRGAVVLAERRGVRPLVIGLTIVAFGTSAPELALNVAVAVSGDTALSFGNMVGSCLSNTGLILGMSALMHPMKVESSMVRRELPMLLGTVTLLIALSLIPDHLGEGRQGLTRLDASPGHRPQAAARGVAPADHQQPPGPVEHHRADARLHRHRHRHRPRTVRGRGGRGGRHPGRVRRHGRGTAACLTWAPRDWTVFPDERLPGLPPLR